MLKDKEFEEILKILTKQVKREIYNKLTCIDINILKKYNCMLAGGALVSILTNRKVNDYDIYFKTNEDCRKACEEFKKIYETSFLSPRAISFEDSYLQLIRHTDYIIEDPNVLIKGFDFRCCAIIYDFETEQLHMLKETYGDILSRTLTINNSNIKYPIVTLNRVRKYTDKGFTINGTELIKLALIINSIKMKNYADLKDQLQGIDTQFLYEFTEHLNGDTEYDKDIVINDLNSFIDKEEDEITNINNISEELNDFF